MLGGDGAASSSIRLVCRVCQKQYANYTCPRCNLRYCSLQCYKGHSMRCTESFMRDNVVAEMKNVEVSPENKRRMLETLKRVYAEEGEMSDADEGESVLSEETLQKLIMGGEFSLEDLSITELKAFKRALAAGELSHLIEPWEPWWLKPAAASISLSKQGNSLVQVVDDASGSSAQAEVPAPPTEPLPPLSHLSKVQPSPLLPVHLIELLYCYCFVLRLYNGEWKDSSLDAATDLLTISRILSQSAVPETVSEVISYCLETLCSPAFKHAGGYQLGLSLCDDIAAILRNGKAVVICALADLHRLLETSVKESKLSGHTRKRLQVASRKVFYIMCWANELGDTLPSFAALVEAEKQKLLEMRCGGTVATPMKCVELEELLFGATYMAASTFGKVYAKSTSDVETGVDHFSKMKQVAIFKRGVLVGEFVVVQKFGIQEWSQTTRG